MIFEEDGIERTLDADRVVNGAGRIANTEGLDLESGQVAIDHGRLLHDDHLRSTSNKAVWIVGDMLSDTAQLSPLATYEGRLVGRTSSTARNTSRTIPRSPSASTPSLRCASVGLTEEDARDRGLDVHVAVNDMREWLSGRTFAEPVAWTKVISERATGRILGAHIIGHGGEELIHVFALAMRHGITTARLRRHGLCLSDLHLRHPLHDLSAWRADATAPPSDETNGGARDGDRRVARHMTR